MKNKEIKIHNREVIKKEKKMIEGEFISPIILFLILEGYTIHNWSIPRKGYFEVVVSK